MYEYFYVMVIRFCTTLETEERIMLSVSTLWT